MVKKSQILRNSQTLVKICGNVVSGNHVLLISDDTTEDIAKYLLSDSQKATQYVRHLSMKSTSMHGIEPPANIAKAMLEADVIFGLTKNSMAHTEARMNATNNGARYLSLADYSEKQMERPSIDVDYKKIAAYARRIKSILDKGNELRVYSEKGTWMVMNLSGRTANCCPGFCNKSGTMGSPPDIETNISPLEEKSEGVIIVDGSIPCKEIGLLSNPIKLEIKNGSIADIVGGVQATDLEKVLALSENPKRGILAEFGIGLNPKAKLCGLMLEDEGCYGTVHFGFGSNYTVGGKNKVDFHLDFLVCKPEVYVDGILLMKEGEIFISGRKIPIRKY